LVKKQDAKNALKNPDTFIWSGFFVGLNEEEVLNHRGGEGIRCKEEGLWCRVYGMWCMVCGGFTVEATVVR